MKNSGEELLINPINWWKCFITEFLEYFIIALEISVIVCWIRKIYFFSFEAQELWKYYRKKLYFRTGNQYLTNCSCFLLFYFQKLYCCRKIDSQKYYMLLDCIFSFYLPRPQTGAGGWHLVDNATEKSFLKKNECCLGKW